MKVTLLTPVSILLRIFSVILLGKMVNILAFIAFRTLSPKLINQRFSSSLYFEILQLQVNSEYFSLPAVFLLNSKYFVFILIPPF